MYNRLTLRPTTVGPYSKRNRAMAEPDRGLAVSFSHREQVASPPQVVTLTLDELPWCLPRLRTELRLLVSDPPELGHGIGAGHLGPCSLRRDKRDAAARRVHRQVDMLDVLARHRDGDLAELDCLCHQ